MVTNRIVSWFSCGAASAVATKLLLAEGVPITMAYCRVREEHPDNLRFLNQCKEWFNHPILVLENQTYKGSCMEVFKKNYFRTPHGSPCTRELKRKVRLNFQQPDDIIVFGYTAEEEDRLNDFIDRNNEVEIKSILDQTIQEKIMAVKQFKIMTIPYKLDSDQFLGNHAS